MVVKNRSLQDEIIYSTHPEFESEYSNFTEPETLKPEEQDLVISLGKRKIDGKIMTIVSGFVGSRIELLELGDELQEVCHADVSSRKYELHFERDVHKRAFIYLRNKGYKVRFAYS